MRQEDIKRLQELHAEAESVKISEVDRLRAKCDHSYPDKKAALDVIDRGRGIYRCRLCRKTINISGIKADELKRAVQLVDDAVQNIKLGSVTMGDTTREQLGNLTLVLQMVPEMYNKATVNEVNSNDYRSKGRVNSMPNGMAQLFGAGQMQGMKPAGNQNHGKRHI